MTISARILCATTVAVLLSASVSTATRQGAPPVDAVPTPPIQAVLDAFRSHALVALADSHGNEQIQAVRLSLIRDPAFPAVVNDIVVEFGNARYQDVIDRFVRGGDVPDAALRQVWQNTTQQNAVWDRPIYEEFFRTVRTVNSSLPPDRQLRVLLGDPPVDWSRGMEDAGTWTPQRDRYAAEVIEREVLAKQRRALVIYGGGHLFRMGQSLVSLLERNGRTRVFTITTPGEPTFDLVKSLQPGVMSWPAPSIAKLEGTVLQNRELIYYDAFLYLGPPSSWTFSRLSSQLCSDKAYVQMRLERLAVLGQRAVDSFNAECARTRDGVRTPNSA
jgi:hypothetical protein